jgi:PAS domain-containing protein
MAPTASGRTLTTEELYALLEDVQDALFVTDPTGEVVFMNAAASNLRGLQDRVESEGGTIHLRTFPETTAVRTMNRRPVAEAIVWARAVPDEQLAQECDALAAH